MHRISIRVIARLAALLILVPALAGQAWAQSSPSAFTWATRYDDGNRVTGTIAPDPDGGGSLHYLAVRNTYDTAGRLVTVQEGELSSWQSDSVAPQDWTGFTIFRTTTITYNQFGQKATEALVNDGVYTLTQYSYDTYHNLECTAVRMNPATYGSLPASACTLTTPVMGGGNGPDRITRNVYDITHRVTKVQKAYGVTTANGFPATLQQDYETYTLSNNGKPLTIADANGNKASLTYDGFDRQVQWNFPSQTSAGTVSSSDYEAYAYDANDNRTSFRKRDGRTFYYSYDNLNRMTAKTVPDNCVSGYICGAPPTSAQRDLSYTYDLLGHQLTALFQTGDGLINTYDGFGRLATATNTMSGSSRTLSYQYDPDGDRTQVTHPDGNHFDYSYDGLDRMIGATENGGTAIIAEAYGANGRESSLTRGAVTSTYSYDPVLRPVGMTDDLAGSSYDMTRGFGYNPASQITTLTRSNNAYAFTGYATASTSYAVNGLNQYTAVNTAAPGYDSNGNLNSDGSTAYIYDADNRLVTASGAKNANLVYDPGGRLFSMYDGINTVQFVYDGDELVMEYNGSGSVVRRYVHGPDDDDPMIWYEGSSVGSGNRRSLQGDHEGSIVSVADAGGSLLILNSYDEYGVPAATNDGRFQYTGQAWLPALGLYYYKARMYSSRLGRFLQTDPIGYEDQVNLYAYVGNDPTNRVDPTGRDDDWWGAVKKWTWDNVGEPLTAGVSRVPSDLRDAANHIADGDLGYFADTLPPTLGGVTSVARTLPARVVAAEAREGEVLATTPYARPAGATTRAQRAIVQGKPCVKCGEATGSRVAGHTRALVQEHYETGTIDRARMRSVEAVRPECPTCSAREGAEMSRYSKRMRARLRKNHDD